MSLCRTFGLAIFATVCLLGGTIGSAYAQCTSVLLECATEWSGGKVINLGGLPGSASSVAEGINDAGQVVGQSGGYAIEWSGGKIIKLGPGAAFGINNVGQVVGESVGATEWSGGSVINLGGLPGYRISEVVGINDAGQAVGYSEVGKLTYATEWSGSSIIDLGPGAAFGINNVGQVVGESVGATATEWSGGSVINLGGLPGSTFSEASSINDAAQAVGFSLVDGQAFATEWSGGKVIDLGGLPGSASSVAEGINDAGQVVGYSLVGGNIYATEWSGGSVITLGGYVNSVAIGINDAGQAVGYSDLVPEPSTWAMMLVGFASLGFAGYFRARTLRISEFTLPSSAS